MDAIIVPFPKKGNLWSCDNWRGSIDGGSGDDGGQGKPRKAIETSRERETRLSVWISQRTRMVK